MLHAFSKPLLWELLFACLNCCLAFLVNFVEARWGWLQKHITSVGDIWDGADVENPTFLAANDSTFSIG